ncbi:hypothetical protein G6O69_10460 [Pseudenhygromyxa sp. WMMC2535]|uniref:hypothetical protein n=1 Tax=Pseudenhygromyxa sp. WMMC2535 TaxID=2712867 RepID=UPI0015575E54|nr:hypothetical protein [Pseudenhygromyxa sp. WMMC2535]NVB38253.1 hypothetical protein [Pseudenhygromyxa sp. WMMC2535]
MAEDSKRDDEAQQVEELEAELEADARDPELEEMADAVLEDELADAVLEAPSRLPLSLLLPALVLVAAIAAPLHPEGYSFALMLYAIFLRSPLEAVFTLLGFGAPFCFGALVAATAWVVGRAGEGEVSPAAQAIIRRALVVNLSFLHAHTLLLAFVLTRAGGAMMPLALLGFAVVSGFYFIYRHAQASASAFGPGGGLSLEWLVRWGATVIVALCGWLRLQVLAGVRLGWAVEVVLAACMAMTVILVRRRRE